MYLYGRKFHWTDWENDKNNAKEDGFKISETILSIGYWRKHPNLHGYIVKNFADGVDECQDITLGEDEILQTIQAIRDQRLPHTEGFCFGESDGSEDAESIETLARALEWLKTPDKKHARTVYYRASW